MAIADIYHWNISNIVDESCAMLDSLFVNIFATACSLEKKNCYICRTISSFNIKLAKYVVWILTHKVWKFNFVLHNIYSDCFIGAPTISIVILCQSLFHHVSQ